MGEWMYRSTFFDLDSSWRSVVSFTPSMRKRYPVKIGYEAGRPYSRSERYGSEKNILLSTGIET
jgi:hypothetical protein